MRLKQNQLKKIDNGSFYTIINVSGDHYVENGKKLKKATDLTASEYACISEGIDSDLRHSEQVRITRAVFGKTAFIDTDVE